MEAITYKGQKVITTELLAQAYEASTENIRRNFNRNRERFIEGKHYFSLTGDGLREFKRDRTDSPVAIPANVNTLYLWTERGANRHSKILDTDKAWEQFENLENTYFRVKETGVYAALSPNLEVLRCLSGLANYLRTQRIIMQDKGCSPEDVALMDSITCKALGIPLPECFTEPKTFEQLALLYNQTLGV